MSNTHCAPSTEQILALLQQPLPQLMAQAMAAHAAHRPGDVQLASLLSVRTGGCPEDCAYCPQSAHYAKKTGVKKEALANVDTVLEAAQRAKDSGATRFCMGAAWREVREGEEFDRVLTMVRGVRAMGMEACVTLGMLTPSQAAQLAEAGLTAYNHNLDTSPEFYDKIITTRTYQQRLDTLQNVANAGMQTCCGGIIGMGESLQDRAHMLHILASMTPPPSSVPINALEPVAGTPLENQSFIDPLELVRTIAVARIVMPHARVRLSAGRQHLSREAQALCLLAGADSIFYGDKLLTAGNPEIAQDQELLAALGIAPQVLSTCATESVCA